MSSASTLNTSTIHSPTLDRSDSVPPIPASRAMNDLNIPDEEPPSPVPRTIIISHNMSQAEGTANTYAEKNRLQNGNEAQINLPLSPQEKKNYKKNKDKISKEQLGAPEDFKWVTHIGHGFNEDLSNSNVDNKIQGFFDIPSSSSSQAVHNKDPSFCETPGSTSSLPPNIITHSGSSLSNNALKPPPQSPLHTTNEPPPTPPKREIHKKQNENGAEAELPLPLQQKRNNKMLKKKLSKGQISAPQDFRHVAHVGYDPNLNIDDRLQGFFDIVGVSQEQLSDTHSREFIYDFIEKNGGIDKAMEESQRFDALTPEKPELSPQTINRNTNSLEYTSGFDHIIKSEGMGANRGSNIETTVTSIKASDSSTSPATSIASDDNWHSIMSNESSDEDGEWGYRIIDTDVAGVKIRALYDYQGADLDELSFNVGDIFEKLEDEGEQGWCTGRKDGLIGLYPPNYVELVEQ